MWSIASSRSYLLDVSLPSSIKDMLDIYNSSTNQRVVLRLQIYSPTGSKAKLTFDRAALHDNYGTQWRAGGPQAQA
jgi:hypothetical protein